MATKNIKHPKTIMYNHNGEEVDVKGFVFIDSGYNARIYKREDEVLKVYKSNCNFKNCMSRKVFNLIKESDVKNLVKLREYLYNNKSSYNKMLGIDAYTMDYVDGKRVKLLDASKEYIEKVSESLDETLEALSKLKLYILDTNSKNIIFTEDGVTIIDLDMYSKERILSKEYLKEFNKTQMMNYIRNTIKFEIREEKNRDLYLGVQYLDYRKTLSSNVKSFFKEDTIRKSLNLKNNDLF